MAARKRTSRAPKRSTKRPARGPARGKAGSGSFAPVVALAAILGLGAFSLWSTSQHKSPQAALVDLFQRPSVPRPAATAPARTEQDRPAVASKAPEAVAQPKEKDHAAAVGPVPRPAASVAPAAPKPVQQAAAVQPPKPPHPTRPVTASAPTGVPRSMPPRGVNTPAHSPSVVYARARLTIHKNAWDKSSAIGTVEKGREMRSYGKTGRWHRVIVPKTNMIGWVHEDHLIGGRDKPDSATLITGSISKKPEPAKSAPKASQPRAERRPEHRIEPPRPIGQKN